MGTINTQNRIDLDKQIINDFYNNQISLKASDYNSIEEFKETVNLLFTVLSSWKIYDIISVLKQSFTKKVINDGIEIPQFSDFFVAVHSTPQKLMDPSNHDVSYIDMGKILDPRVKEDGAHNKYGENHSKTAFLLGLATIDNSKVNISDFGKEFMSLNPYMQAAIIPALCLKLPLLYNYFCQNENWSSIDSDMNSGGLSDSTKGRRRSNVNAMISVVKSGFYSDIITFSNPKPIIVANQGANLNSAYRHFLTAIRTKPFVLLAGISGTGKSRIVRRLAQASVTESLQKEYDLQSVTPVFDRWKLHKPANFELIQVKPNWHNSMEVVGYKSNIGGSHYEFTPFIEFIARAWLHQEVPFFLCLDEMNLAPVEQYFAEFLSAIESRTKEGGKYLTDPIIKPFESFDTKDSQGTVIDCLSDAMIAKLIGPLDTPQKIQLAVHFKTKGLTLPQNLIVMGTVNMDETTFSFSRKVLDRAMSIVMNEVNIESYFNGQSDIIDEELTSPLSSALIDRPIKGLEEINNDTVIVRQFFNEVNELLENTPFKLGYRAINELLLYSSAAKLFGSTSVNDDLDQFALMKILSRIEGDKRSIKDLLEKLQTVIDGNFTNSNMKLKQMAETLKESQFVSYWT